MRILRLPSLPLPPSAVTIGNFDGVHLGHQAILTRLSQYAREHQLASVVMMFEPQPLEFISPDQAPPRLSSLGDKVRRLAAFEIDYLCVVPFNAGLRSLSADAFVTRILQKSLSTQWLQVGDDFRFGADRAGNVDFLRSYDFDVTDMPSCCVEETRVSSTRVRNALSSGDLSTAATLLGEPYTLCGRVIYGRQIGRTIGVPTANILLTHKRLACQGVFAITAEVDGRTYQGVANLGAKPTVGDERAWLEVHLFEFNGQLYGKRLAVALHQRLRGIQTFDNLTELKFQIQNDMQAAKAFFTQLTDVNTEHD